MILLECFVVINMITKDQIEQLAKVAVRTVNIKEGDNLFVRSGIHNYEQYRSMVGKGEGLSKALLIIDDILTENDEAE